MSGPDKPDFPWGSEPNSDPTRVNPTPPPTPGQGQPYTPQPWGAAPVSGGSPTPPPPPPGPPSQGAWTQPPQQGPAPTPGWGQPPVQPPQQQWGPPPQQQWGPPTQQQWQPPADPNQPQYGAFPQSTGGKSKLPLIIGLGAAAVIVLVLIGGALFLLRPKVLDAKAVNSGVENVLTSSYGLQDVNNVDCPSDQKVKADASFTCSVSVDGEARTVTIKILDDKGTYEVSKPQ